MGSQNKKKQHLQPGNEDLSQGSDGAAALTQPPAGRRCTVSIALPGSIIDNCQVCICSGGGTGGGAACKAGWGGVLRSNANSI